jgi:hypothetical protein
MVLENDASHVTSEEMEEASSDTLVIRLASLDSLWRGQRRAFAMHQLTKFQGSPPDC